MSFKSQLHFSVPFSFARFRYTLLPENELFLPLESRGHILRGAFGNSLKRLACANHNVSCQFCSSKESCAYFHIFAPREIISPRRLRDTPRGFVLKPSLEKRDLFTRDHPFSFEFVLIGNRIQYYPWTIVPINALGNIGIGPRRGRFELANIEAIKNSESVSIYDANTKMVKNEYYSTTYDDLKSEMEKLNKYKIKIEFLTPTRIRYNSTGEKGKSQVVRVPEFHHIIKRLRDRINVLAVVYGEGPLEIDFKGLGERAEAIKITDAKIKWLEIKRRSRSQRTWHDQSGFLGEVTYSGHLEEFLPLLVLGQYIHVGEDAVFGNGWYRLT